MKDIEIRQAISEHVGSIGRVCAKAGAPFGTIAVSGAMSISERRRNLSGRITVVLADIAPGWRRKDNPVGRKALAAAIKAVLASAGLPLAVRVQSVYEGTLVDAATGCAYHNPLGA